MGRPAAHTPEELDRALAIYREHGAAEASRQSGIKETTIRSAASRKGIAAQRNDNTKAAVEASRLQWEERRTALVHKIGEAAEKALEHVNAELDDGKLRNAKDAATTMAILVDKAQVLSGGATARFGTDTQRAEVVSEAREKALRLVG